jgi:hypothetical protein
VRAATMPPDRPDARSIFAYSRAVLTDQSGKLTPLFESKCLEIAIILGQLIEIADELWDAVSSLVV